MMKKLTAMILSLAMVLCMASAASADKLSEIKEKGELIVGASVGFPPYEFYYTNPETGVEDYAGFDMMLAKGIAEKLGVKLTVADQAFAGLITALNAGEIDMIISGLAVKPERLEVVDFSDQYYTGTQILCVAAENADKFKTVEDMAGKKIGAQMGSLQAGILEEQFAASEPLMIDSIQLLVMDVLQGNLDGVLLTDMVALQYMAINPGKLAISEVPVVYDNAAGVGVAVQKGDNASLLAIVNEYIAQVTTDGTFDAWVLEAVAQNATLVKE